MNTIDPNLGYVPPPIFLFEGFIMPKAPEFNRIRRITGYLTSSVKCWNDAKKSELKDRVAHFNCTPCAKQ